MAERTETVIDPGVWEDQVTDVVVAETLPPDHTSRARSGATVTRRVTRNPVCRCACRFCG